LKATPIRAFLAICWKCRLVCNLKNFDFLHCELLRAHEEVLEGSVIRVRAVCPVSAKANVTVAVCVAVIGNSKVIAAAKYCTACGIALDCELLLFRPQHEFPRRNAVQIP
jgi:hypothetical protein